MIETTFDLPIYPLTFILEAQTLVNFGPQAGAQLRGALWTALENHACTDPGARHHPEHAQHCPMCRLVALQAESARGINPPRPFAIRPPLAPRTEQNRRYETGEKFIVGITLFGNAVDLFPYLCQAVYHIGQIGTGYGRGCFHLLDIQFTQPFSGDIIQLMHDMGSIILPKQPINATAIQQIVKTLPTDTLRLRFLTPTQLKQEGQFIHYPDFTVLIARLLERCQAIAHHYAPNGTLPQSTWENLHHKLTTTAKSICMTQDNTRWVDVASGSRRSNRRNSIGGFVGEVLFEGDLAPFLPWIFWGQLLQVGKNVVKGNGWYKIDLVTV